MCIYSRKIGNSRYIITSNARNFMESKIGVDVFSVIDNFPFYLDSRFEVTREITNKGNFYLVRLLMDKNEDGLCDRFYELVNRIKNGA